jgi:hypothetical protein
MNTQSDSECRIYDLVEYKLKKWVDSFYLDSEEWHHAMHILAAYLEGDVAVQWTEDKIQISVLDNDTELQN